jgi:hypothetical protein
VNPIARLREGAAGTCGSCRYWSPCAGDTSVGDCDSALLVKGYGDPPAIVPSNMAFVEADEGWAFLSGPDFGCVNWEPNE